MSLEQKPLEDPEIAKQGNSLLTGWGKLADLDEDDGDIFDRFEHTIEKARELAPNSIVAASLVDIEENSSYSKIAKKLKAAKQIRKSVFDWQRLLNQEDEAALVVTENTLAIINTDPVRLRSAYMTGRKAIAPETGAWILMDAPRMTYDSVGRGKANGQPQSSHWTKDSGGGYCSLSIPLHEIAEGHKSPLHELPVPPLTIGREAVAELYRKVARHESSQSVTEHRNRTLSYAIWHVRNQDDGISSVVDDTVEKYGLLDTWRQQYCTEVAAKVAHVILEQYTDEQLKSFGYASFFLSQPDSFLGTSESEIFCISKAELYEAITRQCGRLALSPNGEDVERALKHVTER